MKYSAPPEINAIKEPQTPLICTFGWLRPYKGIPAAVRVMKTIDRPFHFVIAGTGPVDEVAAIQEEIGGDSRFTLISRRLSDGEIAGLTRASSLVLFNFKSILNSGSVLASLSIGRPVLAPAMGAILDLQLDLGSRWVKTFIGALTAEAIIDALGELPSGEISNMYKYSPNEVAREHVAIYLRGSGVDPI